MSDTVYVVCRIGRRAFFGPLGSSPLFRVKHRDPFGGASSMVVWNVVVELGGGASVKSALVRFHNSINPTTNADVATAVFRSLDRLGESVAVVRTGAFEMYELSRVSEVDSASVQKAHGAPHDFLSAAMRTNRKFTAAPPQKVRKIGDLSEDDPSVDPNAETPVQKGKRGRAAVSVASEKEDSDFEEERPRKEAVKGKKGKKAPRAGEASGSRDVVMAEASGSGDAAPQAMEYDGEYPNVDAVLRMIFREIAKRDLSGQEGAPARERGDVARFVRAVNAMTDVLLADTQEWPMVFFSDPGLVVADVPVTGTSQLDQDAFQPLVDVVVDGISGELVHRHPKDGAWAFLAVSNRAYAGGNAVTIDNDVLGMHEQARQEDSGRSDADVALALTALRFVALAVYYAVTTGKLITGDEVDEGAMKDELVTLFTNNKVQ